MMITDARATVDLTLRGWLDRLLVDEAVRRSAQPLWQSMQWDNAWHEEWITTFLLPPEDF